MLPLKKLGLNTIPGMLNKGVAAIFAATSLGVGEIRIDISLNRMVTGM